MRLVIRIVLLALLTIATWSPVAMVTAAQVPATGDAVEVTTEVESSFPQGMTFSTSIPLPSDDSMVDAVQIVYRTASDPTLHLDLLESSAWEVVDGQVQVAAFVDFLYAFIPSGVDVTFSWEVSLEDGSILRTADEVTQWADNRYDWELRTSEQVRMYTYGASDDFADMMLDTSQSTIDELESRYNLESIPSVTIWVYDSYDDFSGTLQGNMRDSIAGLTYADLDTIVAIVPDGNEREFGRVILHEISHQAIFAATENPYGVPPMWFIEGIALHTQVGGTEFFAEMVKNALEDGTLFDIQSLDANFPYQPQQATLAYAASWSMLLYIETTWGPDGTSLLVDAFAAGLPTDEAVQSALGVSLDDLNDGWRAWVDIGSPPG